MKDARELVAGMSAEEVMDMLVMRAQNALDADQLDRQFEDVFCGIHLDTDRTLHIYRCDVFKEIAKKLEKKVVISPYTEEEKGDFTYLGLMYFDFSCCGLKWKVFSLYSSDAEVVL